MISYGEPPALDEIEVSIFGPGYGEAIAVHLGENTWILVDSCINPDVQIPATLHYLDEIGINSNCVHVIVASHWHDDHVRGLSQLANKYNNAEIVISAAFNDHEAAAFLSAYSGQIVTELTRGTKELFNTIAAKDNVKYAHHKHIVFESILNNIPIRIVALSPLPATFKQFVAHISAYQPRYDKPINIAPDLKPNRESIALHIDIGNDAILLGSDLEEDKKFGWTAIAQDRWSGSQRPATVYKVAHHGSLSGDCELTWEVLLHNNPIACVTPFTNGSQRLPSDTDKKRIRSNAQDAYITSGASKKPDMDSRILKRLGDICNKITKSDSRFGALRLRRKKSDQTWKIERFGEAQKL